MKPIRHLPGRRPRHPIRLRLRTFRTLVRVPAWLFRIRRKIFPRTNRS